MNGLKTTTKALHELADNLAKQGLCNTQPMDFETWQAKRDGQDYTRIAYAQGMYGIICELYFCKGTKDFALV